MPDRDSTPGIHFDATPNGRVVTLDGPFGRATVHEHGAHLTSWIPAGDEEAIFTSRLARIDGRSAIRGGVPVIFPQFGPGPITKHGFARTARWTLGAQGTEGGAPWVRMDLADGDATRATWPHEFQAQLTVRAERAFALSLAITNTGEEPFSFTGALHTYLRVADVTRVRVQGLDGVRVRDQLAGGAERVEKDSGVPPGVRIDGSVDRVYVDARAPIAVTDEAAGRTLRLTTRGFPDMVLWNPWAQGARALDDMDDEEWRTMLCVEAAAVATPVTLAPGARWDGTQRLAVERAAP